MVQRGGLGRVLLVEDEDDLAHVVEINLQIAGYDVQRANDGGAGLARAREDPPDLVLLDVMMPVLDGWQVLRALRESAETSDVPVIMLTAMAREEDIIKGHLQGAVRYVTKPFQVDELLETIEDALTPPDPEELGRRRSKTRDLLKRLAELDAGREGAAGVRITGLEALPRRPVAVEPDHHDERLHTLTEKQRYIAGELASGRSARDVADELGVSRSNIYATRKRIARKLGVHPDDVADAGRRMGL